MGESWESGGKEVSVQQVGFNAIGDFIKGTFTGKKFVKSKNQSLYELKGILGSFHVNDENGKMVEEPIRVAEGAYYNVWGKEVGKEGLIDDLFKKAKLGEIVAIQFKDETPSMTKGNHPFKIYKTLQFGMDPNYMGESSSVEDTAREVGLTD